MKNNILLMLMILIVSSCGRKVSSSITSDVQVTDSLIIRETVVYDTIVLPGDTTLIETVIECDSNGRVKPFKQVVITSGKKHSVTVDSAGLLQSFCMTDSLQLVLENIQRDIERTRNIKSTFTSEQVKRVQYIPRWIWILLLISLALNSFSIIKILFKWKII